ncbi:hypothetical protein IH992_17195 [Candidatus Poribacteria bacterium]|nr:hypothetical protein [Candidatus Poribacteria bacterium]
MKVFQIRTLIFILMAIDISITHASIEREVAWILTLSDAEKRMINTAEPYAYDDYIVFGLMASGVPESQIAKYKQVVDGLILALTKSVKIESVSTDAAERAEFILRWLHQNLFRRYDAHQTKIDEVLKHRNFNCVSSGVLYSAICRKFGIHVTGVIVPDHAFCQLKLPNQKIDIETTIRYGFDPSSKKKLFDEFGKLTGLVYVSPRNYRQRSEIGDKEMIALIYSNRYKALSDQDRHAEATKVLHVGWRLAGDLPRALNTWESGVGNYIISLDRSRRFADALYVIDEVNRKFPDLKQSSKLWPNVYINWSYHALQAKRYDEAVLVLKQGLAHFPQNYKLLQNLKAAYLEKAQLLGRTGHFTEAHETIETGIQAFPHEEKFRHIEANLYIQEADELLIDQAETVYQKAIQKYPKDKTLLESFEFLYLNLAQKFGSQGKYVEAVQILERGETVFSASTRIRKVKTATHNNWGIDLAKKKHFAEAKQVIERGLAISATDATLKNNWDFVMLEWAKSEFNSGHFNPASTILQEGLKQAKSDQKPFRQRIEAYYNDSAIKLLKHREIQKGINRLEAGLKLVPNSKVMRDNLKRARENR